MPSQVTVGGLVGDVFSFMGYTYWSLFQRDRRRNDPDVMLREVATTLRLTKDLIKNNQANVALGDYARLAAMQRRYQYDLLEEQAQEPPYPDENARRARIAALRKAIVELRRAALIVTEPVMLASDGIFTSDEPTPAAPAETTDDMISSLFSKWPALWLLGSHPMACFNFTIGLQLFNTFGPRTRARIPRTTVVVGDDGFVINIPDDPLPASAFFGGLGATGPRQPGKEARKANEKAVTVRKLKQLLLDVERELP